ncbi:MAG: hypothetical protein A2845_05520 [Candidatus Lloydbacteria bacterium RIFCSPHIGHO2_01_FULL_49_22]|uniref:4Fe-4S ferredoxin-type domain-containing protein n=1 Tax=Candidatus Lloydbacteria bacterium RIFCSPHIGHO2_01_FULL_49_22 TaxID=1798658 RepID=A0A1G2CTW3_9BACT|nr:MAG: hypothetical protein A2845_05520 [Candidatus Lloydbacteria bacterium RIFCSPHIGHO2_01_FULL_49_22]OGZ09661.1 MAG: hypothetical protein A3C14_02830 [Candidatus Lloydbacteria bacterium RIFCSPHIGHO2_02_FULL_50_18]
MGVKKITIHHQREKCIGCGSCVLLAPKNWKMNDNDGKSDLEGGVLHKNGVVSVAIDEGDCAANKEASDTCPVNIIRFE